MATPNTKDIGEFKRWCIEEVLGLLRTNTGPSESDPSVGYDLIEAAYDLVEGHPELVQSMMDIEGLTFSIDGDWLDGDEMTPRAALDKVATHMAINIVEQFAVEDPEVKRISASRQFPHWQPPA